MRRSIVLSAALAFALAACGGSDDEGIATVDDVASTSADETGGADDGGVVNDGEPDVTAQPPSEPVDDAAPVTPGPDDPDDPDEDAPTPAISVSPNANPDLVAATTVAPASSSDAEGFDLDPDGAAVRGAVGDLADRLEIDATAVSVVSARAVTWPDSSLGCPLPGMQYLQVLTDGAEVVLEASGVTYRYTGGSPLALCDQPSRPADS